MLQSRLCAPGITNTKMTFAAVPLTAPSVSSTLLPAGYLSTDGNQIIDAAGVDVRIASVGWNQNFTNIPATVAAIAASGFNTIRVSWDDADLHNNTGFDLQRLQAIVAAAGADGLKVIIDHHNDEGFTNPADGYGAQQKNGLWYDLGPGTNNTNGAGVAGTVTQASFQADWVTIAQAFAGNSTVIGFDLDNEPTSVGNVTWGPYGPNGGYGPTDIHAMYQNVGDAIQAVDPGALIICEGPQNYGGDFAGTSTAPEGDLSVAGADPVVLTEANKVVYSVHEYPTEISGITTDTGPAAVTRMNQAWGYLETTNIAPVWIGEMGSSMISANSQAWAATMIAYMNGQDGAQGGPTFTAKQQPVAGDWWVWGNFPGESPDGTTNANGSLNAAQEAVWSQLLPINCFAHGTRILTTRGEIPVEQLRTNDHAILHTGGTAPIQWIGHRSLAPARHPNPAQVNPIRIAANALMDGIPRRDLFLSPDHALYLNGALIPAKSLLNGSTIRQEPRRTITYYHIELPHHAVLYAEGTPAESYLETGNRNAFSNGGGALTLHPDFAQTLREQTSCAPFAESGPIVEQTRAQILARTHQPLTNDPALTLQPNPDGSVIISSRSAIPGYFSPDPRDQRTLGVKILSLHAGSREINLDHPRLTEGWHGVEPDGRWTNGSGIIPAALAQHGPITIKLAATLAYPTEQPTQHRTRQRA
jgi:aryl-phospho-beta-D-glucosidase BglC (GH1 family)